MNEKPIPPGTSLSKLLFVITFVLITAVLSLAKEVFIPIALSILISFLLSPIITWLENHHIKRPIAVVTVAMLVFALVGGIGYMVGGQFVDMVNNLPKYRANIVNKVHSLRPGRESVILRASHAFRDLSREIENDDHTTPTQITSQTLEATSTLTGQSERTSTGASILTTRPVSLALRTIQVATPAGQDGVNAAATTDTASDSERDSESAIPVRVVEGPTSPMQSFETMAGPIINFLATAGLVILFVIFMLIQREDLRDRVIRLAGQNKIRVTTEALEEAASRVSRYLLMQLVVNVTYGIPVAIGLFFIGVPNALLWGAMATILRFIPYIGPWIAASMPLMLSLAVFHGWTQPILVVALFLVIELISNNVMEPILYGHSTGLSPVAIIVSAVFWTWLWGPVGLILSTPITVCLMVLGRRVPKLAVFNVLLGDEPVLSDPERIYNRILSGSTDDALEISEEYLQEHDLEELMDNVLVPALKMAEMDQDEEMLSSDRHDKMLSSMADLLQILTDQSEEETDESKESREIKEIKESKELKEDLPPVLNPRKILCIPAKDDADGLVALMLKKLLAAKGHEVEILAPEQLAGEALEKIMEFNPNTVVISSLPPLAMTQTRYLVKRIKKIMPEQQVIVANWGLDSTKDRSSARLKEAGADNMVYSLQEARQRA